MMRRIVKFSAVISLLAVAVGASAAQPDRKDESKVPAYRSIMWGDDFKTVDKKLREMDVKVEESKNYKANEFVNKFVDEKIAKSLGDKHRDRICEGYGGNYIYAISKTGGVRFYFLFERPTGGKDPAIKTELLEMSIDYSADLPVDDILEKLELEYGEPKIEKTTIENLLFLKQMDETPKKQGYLGFKFVIPVIKYNYQKDGISIVFEVPDYKKAALKDSPEKEVKENNERILAALGGIGEKAKRSIDVGMFEMKDKVRPICEKMIDFLRSGEGFSPDMREVENKCLDRKLVMPNTLTKINERRFDSFRDGVKKLIDQMQERKKEVKDIPI